MCYQRRLELICDSDHRLPNNREQHFWVYCQWARGDGRGGETICDKVILSAPSCHLFCPSFQCFRTVYLRYTWQCHKCGNENKGTLRCTRDGHSACLMCQLRDVGIRGDIALAVMTDYPLWSA